MRNTDDQLHEILRRAEIVTEKRSRRKSLLTDGAAACVCLVLLLAVAVYLPRLTPVQSENTVSRYGSLLLGASYVGYVIVGLLAFALGICVTLLCVHWKKLKEREQE